jgi:hypothetical protein
LAALWLIPIISPISFASKPLGILIISDYITRTLKNIEEMRHFTKHLDRYFTKIFQKNAHLRHFLFDIMSRICDNIGMG